eukprot:TRINITY_DN5802_c1_g1_i3.p1 TRINITY_DN5802_c1_g1~~TRINITY_DN5802_c1_g1_i3.p1  ORF type:complete len:417 (-),score=95.33 TRINITY_DN5802_c1_g1_i3:425-1675(-)
MAVDGPAEADSDEEIVERWLKTLLPPPRFAKKKQRRGDNDYGEQKALGGQQQATGAAIDEGEAAQSRQSRGQPFLIIFTVTGLFIERRPADQAEEESAIRPGLLTEGFLAALRRWRLAGNAVFAVWSGQEGWKLEQLVQKIFGQEESRAFQFVWDQDRCVKTYVRGMRRPSFHKYLSQLRTIYDYFPRRVLLIDAEEEPCPENPLGTSIHPPAWESLYLQPHDRELERLVAYLDALFQSGSDTVPEFVAKHPYAKFVPPQKEESSLQLAVLEAREGNMYPEASLKRALEETLPEDQLCVPENGDARDVDSFHLPDEDPDELPDCGADDDMELAPPEAPATPPEALAPDPREGGWRRVASKSAPGTYYYYNTLTDISQLDPPAPWELRQSTKDPSVTYYFNPETNETCKEPPDIGYN